MRKIWVPGKASSAAACSLRDLASARAHVARHDQSPGDGFDASNITVSRTHLVIIPSFDSGRLLAQTAAAARRYWAPIWVVIDGSTDESAAAVEAMASVDPFLRVMHLPRNCGKGAAVRHGLIAARASGFTHALVMDADGQHPADRVPAFMATSAAAPDALVMGRPEFGEDAPRIRVISRRLCNACAMLVTLRQVGDTLFGFRVYPIAALLAAMEKTKGMRRFDFDPEAVVRLSWDGIPLVHLPTPVRYLSCTEGGVSHFRYARDNLLLIRMFLRLSREAAGRFARRCLLKLPRIKSDPDGRSAGLKADW